MLVFVLVCVPFDFFLSFSLSHHFSIFSFLHSFIYLLIFSLSSLQSLPTLFGPLSHDLTPYSYLALRLRLGLGIRDAWYVNLRTTDMPPTDLWQHRLYFRGDLQNNYGEIRVCDRCLQ